MKRKMTWCVMALAMLVGLTQGDAAPKSNLSDFMRVKLRHSQDVVEGLVLADFEEVEKNAQNMSLPDTGAMMSSAMLSGKAGQSGTMLTGAKGIDKNKLELQRNTLLGG